MLPLEVLRRVLSSLQISPYSPVGVAVSGGSDSVALTFLANQYFKHMVAITVDHQLRPESRQESLQAKSIMESLGLKHQLLTLDWQGEGGKPPAGKTQVACREKRYHALLNECKKQNLNYLLVGHHADDQIETFFYRLNMSSRVIGLSGILPFVCLPHLPEIPVVRPLLTLRKEALKKVCLSNNLKWVEDPSNTYPAYWRNSIRQAVADCPSNFSDGILDIMKTCSEARAKINGEASKFLRKVRINKTHSYITVRYSLFDKLSPPVARRVLETLFMFLRGDNTCISLSGLRTMYSALIKREGKTQTFGGCSVFHYSNNEFGVARQYVMKDSAIFTPIRVGETVHWDNRYDISLHRLDDSCQSAINETFYIRNMRKKDFNLASRGIRKVKSVKLAPEPSRGGLPVIVVEKQGVDRLYWPAVLVPHFQFIDRSYGVKCRCTFRPLHPFSMYLQGENTELLL